MDDSRQDDIGPRGNVWAVVLTLFLVVVGLSVWNSKDNSALLLDALKIVLNPWTVFAVAFAIGFRVQLRGLINSVAQGIRERGFKSPYGEIPPQTQPVPALKPEPVPGSEGDRAESIEELQTELERVREKAAKDTEAIGASVAELHPMVEGLLSDLRESRDAAKHWMLEYLHYYLISDSKVFLQWLSMLPQGEVAKSYYHEVFGRFVKENNRLQILNALQYFHLISTDGERIAITPLGTEFLTRLWQKRDFAFEYAWFKREPHLGIALSPETLANLAQMAKPEKGGEP